MRASFFLCSFIRKEGKIVSDSLEHHGIKGQKWGIIRTPEQLGHGPKRKSGNEKEASGERGNSKGGGSKGGKAGKEKSEQETPSIASMSDDELRARISRLDMELRYSELMARRNPKKTSLTKKLLNEAAENLGRKALGVAVDSIISGASGKTKKEEKFDINKYKDADVSKLDADTISKVAKWYQNATSIEKYRESMKKSGGT